MALFYRTDTTAALMEGHGAEENPGVFLLPLHGHGGFVG